MSLVDAQVHLWAANTPERPWMRRHQPHRAAPMTKTDLLSEMAAAGVDRVVVVPPSWEGDRNDVALDAAQTYPDRFAVMGRIDLDDPASRERIRGWRRQPGMLGLRLSFHREPFRSLLTEGRVDWLWPQAEEGEVPIMVLVPHTMMHLIDRVAERHPGLKLVLDHLGLIAGKDEEAFRDFDRMLPLAKRPNIAAKVSCLPLFTSDTYPFRWLHPYLRRVYDSFGPRRMFWGSDLSRLPCTYRQSITMFTEEIPWLANDELEWIMGRGVCEWLRWQ